MTGTYISFTKDISIFILHKGKFNRNMIMQ